MPRSKALMAFALCFGLGLVGEAAAQSTGAPAGRLPAAAPGGTLGQAGPRNRAEAVRGGDAYGPRRMRRHRRSHR